MQCRFAQPLLKLSFVLALVLVLAAPGSATIGVALLSVTIEASATSGFINVTNAEKFERTVQISLVKWEQVNGVKRETPSTDILLSPPIITIPALGQRTIRFGLRRRNTTPEQLAYRVIVTEVHSPLDTGNLGVAVSMRISIPIFVDPQAASNKKPQWTVRRDSPSRVVVALNDATPYHVHVTGLRVKDASGPVGEITGPTYVLPGESHAWTVPLNRAPNGVATLEVRTDNGLVSIPVPSQE